MQSLRFSRQFSANARMLSPAGAWAALFASLFLFALSALTLEGAEYSASPFTLVYEQSCPSIVTIQGDKIDEDGLWDGAKGNKTYKGMGTGIVIDPRGYIVTNYHVVAEIRKIQVITFDDKNYTATLVGSNTEADLAIIKVNPEKPFVPLKLGRSNDVHPCEDVLAIGNPYGYAFSGTKGAVSGIGRDVRVDDSLIYHDAIQIDVAINPGNSGGPIMNVSGEMVGLIAAIRQPADRIAFAIPVDQVVAVAAKIMAEHTKRFAYHGLQVREVEWNSREKTEAVASKRSSRRHAVLVEEVDPGSPADKAGLQPGDLLTKINDADIMTELEFQRAFIDLKAKEEIAWTVVRNDETEPLQLTCALAPPKYNAIKNDPAGRARTSLASSRAIVGPKTASKAADPVWDTFGLRVTGIEKNEYERRFERYLELYPDGAVTVTAIKQNGPFAQMGVQVGDVIVGVHDLSTTSHNDMLFIAQQWKTFAKFGSVRIVLFRGSDYYFQYIPVK